jgi:hypothetical protein
MNETTPRGPNVYGADARLTSAGSTAPVRYPASPTTPR